MAISLGVSKWGGVKMVGLLFVQFNFSASLSFCVVNTTIKVWRTPPRLNGLVSSAHRRRLTCVLNNINRGHGSVDIVVYRAYTVVADVV